MNKNEQMANSLYCIEALQLYMSIHYETTTTNLLRFSNFCY